jgi:hypothetical protein
VLAAVAVEKVRFSKNSEHLGDRKCLGKLRTSKKTVAAEHPRRIVVSGSGDMAYEYGTGTYGDRRPLNTASRMQGITRSNT